MSGDLISRSKLLEMLNYNRAIHEDESGETRQLIAVDINKMIEYVEKMPTVYNVDKVVEQLEHLLNNFGEHCEDWGRECTHKSCSDCVLSHAIEIVKAGGVK